MENTKLNEQLIELASQYQTNKETLQELVEGISEDDFNKRPSYGGWSIGECINHLATTDADYTAQIETGIQKIRDKNYLSNGPFKFTWFGKKFYGMVEPPVKRKVKNPEKWDPKTNLDMAEVIHDYNKYQDKYIWLINDSAGLDITKVKVPSPATKLLRFTVFEMLNINAAHSRRHQWQAWNVRKDIL